jgi:hypothetical protein
MTYSELSHLFVCRISIAHILSYEQHNLYRQEKKNNPRMNHIGKKLFHERGEITSLKEKTKLIVFDYGSHVRYKV